MKLAFILSSGRTGTQFLAHYLSRNFAKVDARHEPPPARLLRVAAHARLAGRLSDGPAIRLLHRKRRQLERRGGAHSHYVESNPFLATLADLVIRIFPAAHILHIVRDPRDYLRSALNHGMGSGVKGLANRWLPHWYPDVATPLGLRPPLDWRETAAAQWTLVNRVLEAACEDHPHYHRLHYEAIFAEDGSGLDALCRQLELDPADSLQALRPGDAMNQGRLGVAQGWRDWDRATCEIVDRLCGEDMRRYGYGDEPEWQRKLTREH